MITTGVILAGGRSSRMGENKALLSVNGEKIIELIATRLRKLFKSVIIISNTPDDFNFLGLKIFEDIYPGLGPLAGIHSGLVNSKEEKNFIISCDLPLISEEAIKYISEYDSEKPAIIFRKNEQLQYLCGVYKKDLIPLLEDSLKRKELRLFDLMKKINPEIVEANQFPDEVFFNLNNKEDYLLLKEIISNKKI